MGVRVRVRIEVRARVWVRVRVKVSVEHEEPLVQKELERDATLRQQTRDVLGALLATWG